MRSLAQQMFGLLAPASKARLLAVLRTRRLQCASACSGTDLCFDIMREIGAIVDSKPQHVFSCEIDAKKRKWIMSQCSPAPMHMFTNVLEFPNARAFDELRHSCVLVPGCDAIKLASATPADPLRPRHAPGRARTRTRTRTHAYTHSHIHIHAYAHSC
jgi:hypothetical protein